MSPITAFDNLNGHVYFVTTKPGSTTGDLWVTKTDLSGTQLGSMALHGFGHGVQIAVEPSGGTVYLWTEWRASASGFGTRIGRFEFVNGSTLEQTDSRIQDRTPTLTNLVTNPQPAIGHVMQDRFPTTAGESLPNREPEGMAILESASTGPLLAFGFSSGSAPNFAATVFYKSDFE